jgi:hypothetical protein
MSRTPRHQTVSLLNTEPFDYHLQRTSILDNSTL